MASRLDRVLRIVILLQTGVPYNAHQLAQETGVHRRTIFRDIASLRNLGLPIQFDPETARYFLAQDSIIGTQAITTDELTELLLAASLALCHGDLIRRATEKLALRLPPERRKRILALNRALQVDPPATNYPDANVMEQILVALHSHRSLDLVCASKSEPAERQIVLPLRIVFTADECWLAVRAEGEEPDREIRISDIRQATLLAAVPPIALLPPEDFPIQHQDQPQ